MNWEKLYTDLEPRYHQAVRDCDYAAAVISDMVDEKMALRLENADLREVIILCRELVATLSVASVGEYVTLTKIRAALGVNY